MSDILDKQKEVEAIVKKTLKKFGKMDALALGFLGRRMVPTEMEGYTKDMMLLLNEIRRLEIENVELKDMLKETLHLVKCLT